MSGKRESKTNRTRRKSSGGLAGWWRQHRAWVSGLDRGQKIRYRLFQFLVVLAVLAIAVCLAARAWITLPTVPNLPSGTVTTDEGDMTFDGAELPDVAKSGRKDGVYTFLLVGQDTGGGGNTDTMLLVTFDSVNKEVHGMSLPRDTMINSSHSGAGHRLNAVYNYNKGSDPDTQLEKGITALKREVGKLTGIIPDFYVVVQWEAVGELVDAIGGVYFDVPRRMYYNDLSQDFKIDLQEGYQLLDGNDAMGLLRWRHNSDDSGHILNSGYANGDLGRIETQQAFMTAVIEKCLQPSVLLPNLLEYIDIFQRNVVTDLSVGNMAYFAKSAIGNMNMDNVAFMTMPWKDAGDGAHVLPIGSQLVEAINDGFNPYEEDISLSDLDLVTSIGSSSSSGSSGSSSSSSGSGIFPAPVSPQAR